MATKQEHEEVRGYVESHQGVTEEADSIMLVIREAREIAEDYILERGTVGDRYTKAMILLEQTQWAESK